MIHASKTSDVISKSRERNKSMNKEKEQGRKVLKWKEVLFVSTNRKYSREL